MVGFSGNSVTTLFSGSDFWITKHFGNHMKPVDPSPGCYLSIPFQEMNRVRRSQDLGNLDSNLSLSLVVWSWVVIYPPQALLPF